MWTLPPTRRCGRRSSASCTADRCRRSAARVPMRPPSPASRVARGLARSRGCRVSRPGRTAPFHRLNRTEYQNAIRDLFGVDGIDIAAMLPADDVELRLRQHRRRTDDVPAPARPLPVGGAAISRLALGDPANARPVAETYWSAERSRQDRTSSEDLPLGTRGGTRFGHHFRSTAITVLEGRRCGTTTSQVVGLERARAARIAIDGARVHLFERVGAPGTERSQDGAAVRRSRLPGEWQLHPCWTVRLRVKAGTRDHRGDVPAARTGADIGGVAKLYTPAARVPAAGAGGEVRHWSKGPFDATRRRARDAEPRRSLYVPASRGRRETRRACARQILSTLARRAFRRPVDRGGRRRVARRSIEAGRAEGGFEAGIERGDRAPAREPVVPVPHRAGSGQRRRRRRLPRSATSTSPRACRSSCGAAFPDEELLDAGASAAGCSDPAVLERRSRGCSPIAEGRRAGRAISPASGCSSATSTRSSPIAHCSRSSTTPCARRCGARPSCCSAASCGRTAASLDLLNARLHVRQRAAGAALRHSERLRQRIPARAAPTKRAAACSGRAAS